MAPQQFAKRTSAILNLLGEDLLNFYRQQMMLAVEALRQTSTKDIP